ncbi:ATP-dependent DNA helicase Q5-like [Venturia canescens]|uniref:ATP-dependent DNA helicase Q5-like n=1 Tax=Venturia canescens TaxID=32260 RepID=UPI001C9C42E1|nr:ATP-dependent DNA helicase Q5-like [Venturia canescens]
MYRILCCSLGAFFNQEHQELHFYIFEVVFLPYWFEMESEQTLLKQLKNRFGYERFMNADQDKATREVFKGKNDVLINLQPGTGKSICFQLPAIIEQNAVTVVYVPTDAIGENHVDLLKKKKINAEYLCARSHKKLSSTVLKDFPCQTTELNFLYVSTDKSIARYIQRLLSKLIKNNALAFLVFEEAHCISSSSHDYRPAYKETTNKITSKFPKIRKIALTGTATREIIENIIHTLGMKNVEIVRSTITFPVCQDIRFIDIIENPIEDLKIFINKCMHGVTNEPTNYAPISGIIFCRKKDALRKLERELRALGTPIVSYHGDLSLKDRRTVRERWIAGEIPVIVTTQKFGFGFEGPNVRFVVHWGMPLSIQQFCQQAGKCVQDGLRTSSRIYFSIEESDNIKMYIKSLRITRGQHFDPVALKIRFDQFIDFCFERKCRATVLMSYFDHKASQRCLTCEACCDPRGLENRIEEFSKFYLEMRRKMIRKLKCKQIRERWAASSKWSNSNNPPDTSLENSLGNFFEGPIVFGIVSKQRECSYNQLLRELDKNYRKYQSQLRNNIKSNTVSEIARSLEFSIFMGAKNRAKYTHDIVLMIQYIRRCREPCGHLMYHEEVETFGRQESPEIIELMDSDSSTETI